jgi:hypothetical protein
VGFVFSCSDWFAALLVVVLNVLDQTFLWLAQRYFRSSELKKLKSSSSHDRSLSFLPGSLLRPALLPSSRSNAVWARVEAVAVQTVVHCAPTLLQVIPQKHDHECLDACFALPWDVRLVQTWKFFMFIPSTWACFYPCLLPSKLILIEVLWFVFAGIIMFFLCTKHRSSFKWT